MNTWLPVVVNALLFALYGVISRAVVKLHAARVKQQDEQIKALTNSVEKLYEREVAREAHVTDLDKRFGVALGELAEMVALFDKAGSALQEAREREARPTSFERLMHGDDP